MIAHLAAERSPVEAARELLATLEVAPPDGSVTLDGVMTDTAGDPGTLTEPVRYSSPYTSVSG